MNKPNTVIYALAAAAIIAAVLFALCSCGAEPLQLRRDGAVNVAVVRPFDSDEEDTAALTVYNFVHDEMGGAVALITDRKPDDGGSVEILVGATARAQSREVRRTLRDGEFAVALEDNKIVIVGGSPASTAEAAQYFVENYKQVLASGVFTEEDGYRRELEYPAESLTVGGAPIADYVIVCPDTGESSIELFQARAIRDTLARTCGAYPEIVTEAREGYRAFEILPADGRYYEWSLEVTGDGARFCSGGLWGALDAADTLFAAPEDGGGITIARGEYSGGDAPSEPERGFDYVNDIAAAQSAGEEYDPPLGRLTVCGADISDCTVVCAGGDEEHAAEELVKYIRYATGVELPVRASAPEGGRVIAVGSAAGRGDAAKEGYVIRDDGGRLLVYGGSVRGTLYGVYGFLREFAGCEFFASDCEVIYRAAEREIPSGVDIEVAPDLEYRDVFAADCLNGDTAAKLNINGYYLRPFSAGEGGGVVFAGGDAWFVHTVSRCMYLCDLDGQPCYTDPDNFAKAIESVRGLLERDPRSGIVSITQNDNSRYCSCAECSRINREEGTEGGAQMRFINAVADAIKDDYPDARILTLAYLYSEAPPKTPARDNVIVMLCPIDRCMAHPWGDCPNNSDLTDLLAGWHSVTDNLYIWNYIVNDVKDWNNTPFMNIDSLYDDYVIFREYGVTGVFNEGAGNNYGTEFAQLRNFLLSRLMWEPDMTRERYDDLTRRFIDAYYGEASQIIGRYYDLMRDLADGRHFSLFSAPEQMIDGKRFLAVRGECAQWLNAAARLCDTPPATQAGASRHTTFGLEYRPLHVSRLRDGFEYLYDHFYDK